jgi:hypothetical protein
LTNGRTRTSRCDALEGWCIETIAPDEDGGRVLHRTSVRFPSPEAARERAVALFRRARVPQARGPKVDAVRVIDGAGYEIFSMSARDEASPRR